MKYALIKKDPFFLGLNDLHKTLDRLFEPSWLSNATSNNNDTLIAADWMPSVDVQDEGNRLVVHANLPGIDPKNIDVSVDGNLLTLKGEGEKSVEEKNERYVHIERARGRFYRQLTLPAEVDQNTVAAKFQNGVLEVVAQKVLNTPSKKITVEVS